MYITVEEDLSACHMMNQENSMLSIFSKLPCIYIPIVPGKYIIDTFDVRIGKGVLPYYDHYSLELDATCTSTNALADIEIAEAYYFFKNKSKPLISFTGRN